MLCVVKILPNFYHNVVKTENTPEFRKPLYISYIYYKWLNLCVDNV